MLNLQTISKRNAFQVTILAISLLFLQSWAQAETPSLCSQVLENPELTDTCTFYESDTRFENFLTEDRIQQCEDLYGEWPRTFKMCLRAASRNSGSTIDHLRACHRNFWYTFDIRNCLKFSGLLQINEINACGERPSDRYRPMKGLQCIGEKVGVWRLEYEERMFQD